MLLQEQALATNAVIAAYKATPVLVTSLGCSSGGSNRAHNTGQLCAATLVRLMPSGDVVVHIVNGYPRPSSSSRSHTPRAPSAACSRHPAHHDCHPVTSDAIFTNRIQIGGSVITALPIMTEPTPHAEHVAAYGMHAGPA